jgi:prolycopene isomerase
MIYEDEKGNVREFDMGTSSINLLRALGIRLWYLPDIIDTIKVLKLMATIPADKIEELQDTSARDLLAKFPMPKGLLTYLLVSFGEGAFESTSDRTSAAEMIKVFQSAMKNGGGRYYKNGIGFVFEKLVEAVVELGGDAIFNTRVEKILVDNNQVTGIATVDGQEFHAPVVISNAGLRQTVLKLVGEEYFTYDYVEWVKGLKSNLACAGFRWFLDAPVLESPMYVYYPEGSIKTAQDFEQMAAGQQKPEKAYVYLGTTSVYPGISPAGKQMVYACMSCSSDPELDITPCLDYVEGVVRKLKPALFKHIEKTETFGPATVPAWGNDIVLPGQGGEAYGLALAVGQTGKKQPKGDSPIQGLFYVGCDAGGSGVGTHQAADSAFNVSKLVLEYLETH